MSDVGGEFKELYTTEGKIKTEKCEYHGVKIKLVQMEHGEIFSTTSGMWEKIPTNWREIVKEQIKGAKTVFLEYFPPDLKIARNIPIVGFFVGRWMKEQGIDIFGEIAEMVAQKRGVVKVADVVGSVFYAWRELGVDYRKWAEDMRALPPDQRADYGGSREEINSLELTKPWAIDARRLMTARALMQEAIMMGDNNGGELVWVGPPAHGLRIKEYIIRQVEAEGQFGYCKYAEELATIGNRADLKKAEEYRKTPGFSCKIRAYEKNNFGWYKKQQVKIF